MKKHFLFKLLLVVCCLSFTDFFFSQTNNESVTKKDTLKEKNIEEVVIKSIRKSITNKGDKTILNIDKNPIYDNLTVRDALEYIPKVSIDDNGISVLGKRNVLILVNGRESSLSINNLPVHKAKKIELISNASSKYDAKYDAVINVVLDKWNNQGLSGNFLYNTTVAKNQVSNFGINTLTYNKNKFSTVFSYALNHDNKSLLDNGYNELKDYNYTYDSKTLATRKVNNFGISSNYEIGKKQNIGLEFSYTNIFADVPGFVNQTFYNKNAVLDSLLTSDKTRKEVQDDFSGNIYYNLKNEKFSLDSYLYYYYSKKDAKRDFRSYSGNQEIFNIYSTIDNKSKNLIANVSGEYNFENNSNLNFGLRAVNSIGTNNQTLSTNDDDLLFHFDETVYAQFIEWNKKINKLDFKIGNRLEYFTRQVNLNSNLNQKQNQLDFFPSLYLGYNFNRKNAVSFSASKKIDRVPFNHILPYSYYTSFNEIIKGNPNLKNQIRYSLELDYVFDNSLYISPFYSYNQNNIENITFVNNDEISYIPQNYDSTNWGLNTTYVKSLYNWWYINMNFNAQKNINKGNILGVKFDNNNWEYSSTLTNVFSLNKLGSLIIQSTYNSPLYYDLYKISSGFKTNIKYSNKFMNDRFVFSITVSDVFDTYYNKTEAINQQYHSVSNKDYSWQQFIIGLSYNFDKGRKSKNNSTKINSSENQRFKN